MEINTATEIINGALTSGYQTAKAWAQTGMSPGEFARRTHWMDERSRWVLANGFRAGQ